MTKVVVWAGAGLLALVLTGLAPRGAPTITVAAAQAPDSAVQFAVADVRAAFETVDLPLRWVTAGVAGSPEVQAAMKRHDLTQLKLEQAEAYAIHPVPGKEPGVLVVGGGLMGVVHGLVALAGDVRLRQPYLQYPVPRSASPDFDFRLVSDPLDPRHPGPAQALRWGYNAVMTEPWPALALYDRYDPALYDAARFPGPRSWVESKRRAVRAELQQAKALHLKVITPGDVILLPAQVQLLYGRELTTGGLNRYCIENPKVQELLTAALDEVFATFPEIDGVLVRTGENYPMGPLSGNTPVSGVCSPQGADSLAATLRFMHEQVVGKHKRELIYRGWDLGATGVHALGASGQRLAAAMPSTTGTTLSYKITETDFWRYNRLNQNLLEGPLPRMVELQAAREYEGKGAFPNYVAAVHANGLPEAPGDRGLRAVQEAGVRRAWVWAKGGGWDGPYVHDPLWVDANAMALGRLLWDVEANPETIAAEWAATRFGWDAAPAVARMLMASPAAALKGFYLKCFAKLGAWTPNNLWVRDDVVAGADKLRELYDGCGGSSGVDRAVAEKDEALAAMRRIEDAVAPYAEASGRRPPSAAIRTSLHYQRTLLETLQGYLTGMFRYYQWTDGQRSDATLRAQAGTALRQAMAAWDAHQQAGRRQGAATPFRDAGMVPTITRALEDLAR